MRQRIWICGLLAVVGILGLCPGAVWGATRYVPSQYSTIQAAINASNWGDQVVVAPGTYQETIIFGGRAITVRSSDGAAVTTIDGQNLDRAVWMNSGESRLSVLDGFTITGGGIVIGWCQPTVKNCILANNTRDNGAGIRIDNASPLITDCLFSNNVAQLDEGGAIQAWGTGRPVIQRCTFTGNGNGTSGRGGAIHLNDPGLVATITDCTFTSNIASDGGALLFRYYNASVVKNCTFVENSGRYGGAVLVHDHSAPTFENCTFDRNSATDRSGALGGCAQSSTTLRACWFTANSCDWTSGAVMIWDSGTSLLIEDSHFADNISADQGGALCADGAGSVTVRRTTFARNSAHSSGGAVGIWWEASVTIEDSTFTQNAAYIGGAINNHNAQLSVARSDFDSNVANTGGAISTNSDLLVEQSVFTGNSAGTGGAIRADSTGSQIVRNCHFEGNYAIEGAAISKTGGNHLTVAGCVAVNNVDRGWMGTFQIFGGQAEITNTTIADNRVYWGAGINVYGGAVAAVANCIVHNNINNDSEPSSILVPPDSQCTVTYSDVQGGYAGEGNINADPLFADPDSGDYRLAAGSPCIDAGSNAEVPAELTTDIEGNERILDGDGNGSVIVDMGAYEIADCNGNTVPDYADIAAGTSSDLDGNDVPDECSGNFAYNVNLAKLYPTIGPAMAEAASGNEIIATAEAFENSPSIDFAGKAVYLHGTADVVQSAGGLIQLADNARLAPGQGYLLQVNGTLRTAVNTGSDVDAGVFELNSGGSLLARTGSNLTVWATDHNRLWGDTRIESNATLNLGGDTWNNGNFTVLTGGTLVTQPFFANDGLLTAIGAVINGQQIDTSNTMHLSAVRMVANSFYVPPSGTMIGYGEFYTDTTNDGLMTMTADTLLVGDLLNNPDAVIRIQIGTTTLIGSLTNLGTIIGDLQTTSTVAMAAAALDNAEVAEALEALGSPPVTGYQIAIQGDYAAGASSSLIMPAGAWKVSLTGRWDSAQDDHARFDMAEAELQLIGLATQTFEVMSKDVGPVEIGLDRTRPGHFPIGQVRIGPSATTVEIVDARDNDGQGQAACEALYVDILEIDAGATFSNPTCKVYYRTLVNHGTVTHPANLVQIGAVPPLIEAAVSRKAHGTAGEFAVNVLAANAVEGRRDGPTTLMVTFDQPIQGLGGLDHSDVALSSGTVSGLEIDDSRLTIQMSGAVNTQPLTVAFPGIAGLGGQVCEQSLCLGVLAGDATGDRTVNVLDLVQVRNVLNQVPTQSTFTRDVTADGAVNVLDLVAIRNVLNTALTENCP